MFELTKAGEGFSVREVWRNIRMKNRQSSSVLHEGFIYGLDEGILACLDVATGELKWKGGRYGHGQVLLAGGHLVITTEEGELVLVPPSPEKLKEIARVPAIDGETWNVPAFADGILLVRNTEADGGLRPCGRAGLKTRAVRTEVRRGLLRPARRLYIRPCFQRCAALDGCCRSRF